MGVADSGESQTPASFISKMVQSQQLEEACFMVLIGFLCHQAAEMHVVNTEGTLSSIHYNSQLCVPNTVAVTPSYFLGTEELHLTASILSTDAYVTRKAVVLQADTQLARNKTNAYSFIQQGVATFAQKRF